MRVLLLVAALLCLKACSATHPRAPAIPATPATLTAAPSNQEQKEQLALGKKLFVERCSRCHGDNGEKPFAGGPSFNQRAIPAEEITRAVNGRFRDKTEKEKQAVIRYIQSITQPAPDREARPSSPHPD